MFLIFWCMPSSVFYLFGLNYTYEFGICQSHHVFIAFLLGQGSFFIFTFFDSITEHGQNQQIIHNMFSCHLGLLYYPCKPWENGFLVGIYLDFKSINPLATNQQIAKKWSIFLNVISEVSNNTEKDRRVKNDTSEFIQYVTFLEFRSLGSFQGFCTLYLIGGSLTTHQKWIVSTQRKWLACFHTKSLTIRVGWVFFRELQVWDWDI